MIIFLWRTDLLKSKVVRYKKLGWEVIILLRSSPKPSIKIYHASRMEVLFTLSPTFSVLISLTSQLMLLHRATIYQQASKETLVRKKSQKIYRVYLLNLFSNASQVEIDPCKKNYKLTLSMLHHIFILLNISQFHFNLVQLHKGVSPPN